MPPRTRWRILAAALALIGAACLVMWSARSTPVDGPAAGAAATPAVVAGVGDLTSKPPAPRPVLLTIPALGVSTALTGLGLQADGTVQVPSDPAEAGWYRLGPPPGSRGSAVILGHVDSDAGPAVFYRLAQLDRGARVRIALDDGTSVTYAVRSVTTYPNADFPGQRVYDSHHGRELNLVTCGGAYDADRGGYQANVVVNARWLSGTRS